MRFVFVCRHAKHLVFFFSSAHLTAASSGSVRNLETMPRSAVVAGVALAAFAAGAAFVVAPTRAPTAPLPQGS